MHTLKILGIVGLCLGGLFGAVLLAKMVHIVCCPPKWRRDEEAEGGGYFRRYPDPDLESEKMIESSDTKKAPTNFYETGPLVTGPNGYAVHKRNHSFVTAVEGLGEDKSGLSAQKSLSPVQLNSCGEAGDNFNLLRKQEESSKSGGESTSSSSTTGSLLGEELGAERRKKESGVSESNSSGTGELFSSTPAGNNTIYPSLQECPSSPIKACSGDVIALGENDEKYAGYLIEGGKGKCLFYSYPEGVVREAMGSILESGSEISPRILNAYFALILWSSKARAKLDVYLGSRRESGESLNNAFVVGKNLERFLYHLGRCNNGTLVRIRGPSSDEADGDEVDGGEGRMNRGNVPTVGGADPDYFVKVYPIGHLLKEDFPAFTTFICGSYQICASGCKGTHEPFRIGVEAKPRTHKYEGNLVKVKHSLEDWKIHDCPQS